jgi:phosphatidylserine/phosphatidylglycerophosphate/cardiolipin synthase-like enzyme
MEEIITHLEESIQDEFFSKAERKSLRALIGEKPLDQHQLNFLRSRIYEMANERVTPENYRFIIEWIKAANSALITTDKQENSDVYFSPGEACRSIIINQLNQAVRDVKICVFTISDDQITDAIITTHKKGVPIQVITDNDKMEDEGSDIEQLADEGIPVKIDNTPNHMHHKFMVVDERALLTGSYNWTRSAARYNHENILLTKETPVIRSYLKEFSQLWKEMSAYK